MTTSELSHLLQSVSLSPRNFGTSVHVNCPFAEKPEHRYGYDKDYKMGLTPQDADVLWHCFVCKKAGKSLDSFFWRLEKEKGIPTEQIRKQLKRSRLFSTLIDLDKLPSYREIHMPKETSYELFPETLLEPYVGRVPKYLLRRGIKLATCKAWELGYVEQESRAFFPVRDTEKKLVGSVGRLIDDALPGSRYKNFWNFPKGKFLYGEHLAPQGAILVLYEGPIDVLKAWQGLNGTEYFPVGSFGSELTPEQIQKALRLTGNRLITMFDPDAAGLKAWYKAKKMAGRKIRLYKAKYPRTDEDLDPGQMEPKEILAAIKNAEII